jgi:serine/threonine protein kinase
MAPEQLRKKARPASDEYALAIIVYEWLCGAPPFDGLPIQVALQHIADPVPSSRTKRPDLPHGVEQVLQRALSKEPEQRFPTVQAFAEALERAAQGVEFEEFPARPVAVEPVGEKLLREKTARVGEQRGRFQTSRRTLLKLGLGAGWVLALAVGSFQLANRLTQPDPLLSEKPTAGSRKEPASTNATYLVIGDAKGNISLFSATNCSCWTYTTSLHAYNGQINAISWAPDNKTFATASDDGTIQSWKTIQTGQTGSTIDEGIQHQQTYTRSNHRNVLSVAWSPDGKYLLFEDDAGTVNIWQA